MTAKRMRVLDPHGRGRILRVLDVEGASDAEDQAHQIPRQTAPVFDGNEPDGGSSRDAAHPSTLGVVRRLVAMLFRVPPAPVSPAVSVEVGHRP